MMFHAAMVALLLGSSSASVAENLPSTISRQIPDGYAVLTSTRSTVGIHRFQLVVLRSEKELPSERYLSSGGDAPDRPLLIFELRPNGAYVPVGRNDRVVAVAGGAGLAGNGCDPFEDHHIAVKGSYFTIENGISCGAHWTDFITFRFDPRAREYVFDNERFESWKINPSYDHQAEALVPDVRRVWRAKGRRPVRFSDWRPPTK